MKLAPLFTQPNNPVSAHPVQPAVPSNTPSRNSGGTADILPQERKRATFDVKKLTHILDGGEQKTKRRHFILSPTEGVDLSEKHNWDRDRLLCEHIKYFLDIHEEFAQKGFVPTREEVGWMSGNAVFQGALMPHYGLFLPTILGQGDDEQIAYWLPKALLFQVIGCYAQTELGHGSNVRGLQTIAEFDKKTQQFVLNTPTLTSMKWWPSTLGRTATHALVYAQLLIDGKQYGVHIFMLQVRDENHAPLPGIEVGDLGTKLGDNANDTGFMRLDNVRVPIDYMLSKYQHVTPEGVYVKSAKKTNEKIHYATMMMTRGGMVQSAGGYLARAVTIATRYSAVRRQGFMNTSTLNFASPEHPILDYQVQRYRVMRQLALCYAMKFTGFYMTNKFSELGGQGVEIQDMKALPEIAATSAGFKALCTILCWEGIEDCRKACGGNGYLMSGGIAPMAADYVWQVSAEGDYVILTLQTARFLIKTLSETRRGVRPTGPCEYMAPLVQVTKKGDEVQQKELDVASLAPPAAASSKQFFDVDYLRALYKFRTLATLLKTDDKLQAKLNQGESWDKAWNACSLQLSECVRAHCLTFMLDHFASSIADVQDPAVHRVLNRLCALFGCTFILHDNWAGYLTAQQLEYLRDAVEQLLDELRPDAVALVDAFDIPDRVLNSTIGRYDGNVYEALYEAALQSSLNQHHAFAGYKEHLRPRLDVEALKGGNVSIKSNL